MHASLVFKRNDQNDVRESDTVLLYYTAFEIILFTISCGIYTLPHKWNQNEKNNSSTDFEQSIKLYIFV